MGERGGGQEAAGFQLQQRAFNFSFQLQLIVHRGAAKTACAKRELRGRTMTSGGGTLLLGRQTPLHCGEELALRLQDRHRLDERGDEADNLRGQAHVILNQLEITCGELDCACAALDCARAALTELSAIPKRQKVEGAHDVHRAAKLHCDALQRKVDEALKIKKKQQGALRWVYQKARSIKDVELDPVQAVIEQGKQAAIRLALLFEQNIIAEQPEDYIQSWRDGYKIIRDSFVDPKSKTNIGLAGDVMAFEQAMLSTTMRKAVLRVHQGYQKLGASFEHCFRNKSRPGIEGVTIATILNPFGVRSFEVCAGDQLPPLFQAGLRLKL